MSQLKYELIYILDPAISTDEIASVATKVEQIVADAKGSVLKKEEWGRRRLAYRIQRFREGHYVFFQMAIDSKAVEEIARNLRLMEKVVKFMIVKEMVSKRKIKVPRKRTPRPPSSDSGNRNMHRSASPPSPSPAPPSSPTPAPPSASPSSPSRPAAPAESAPPADTPVTT